MGRGILIGAVTGFAIGGLIGILSGDDNPDEIYFASTAEEKAKEDAIILTISGGSIGAILGNVKVKISIKKIYYPLKMNFDLFRSINLIALPSMLYPKIST